ncbi:SIMPL domain-containing protein [Actinoplanes sp. NPDC023936]|uniref:SIMPL domain-containing protein n=1 Tax=Actinoplanes sp. NPDC023936 TaxID=3154910 RepID=UPI0033FCF5B2
MSPVNKPRMALPALVALATLVVPSTGPLGTRPASASPSTAPGSPAATGSPAAPGPGASSPAAPGSRGEAGAAARSSADRSREGVLVTGAGQVSGKPDTLSVNFGVEVSAASVGDAMNRASAAATRMRDALVRAGVEKADLQTSDAGINPQRDDKGDVTGYTVNQGLTAKIRNLPKAGATISAAIAAGGDAARLSGATFLIEDDAALLAAARKKAFADARVKAELYAREAGRSLGRVVKVSEETPSYGRPYGQDMASALKAAADSAVPIEPGQQQVSVTVTVEWAFAKA